MSESIQDHLRWTISPSVLDADDQVALVHCDAVQEAADRIDELEAALRDAVDCIEALVDQQAMEDDFYAPCLERCNTVLNRE